MEVSFSQHSFEDEIIRFFILIGEFLPFKDILSMALVSKRIKQEISKNDYLWRLICQRDFMIEAPKGHPAKPSYRFLQHCPRVGDLINTNIGSNSCWIACRVILRVDQSKILVLPTNEPSKMSVLLFIWLDLKLDATKIRYFFEESSSTVAKFHSTRSEHFAMLQTAQNHAIRRLSLGLTGLWPNWAPGMSNLSLYGTVFNADFWEKETTTPNTSENCYNSWLLWCSLSPNFKFLGFKEFGNKLDCKTQFEFVNDKFWNDLQCFSCYSKPLQMCGNVLIDPHEGEILEVLNTVNKWTSAKIISVKDNLITIEYNGMTSNWNEEIDLISQSHRLKPRISIEIGHTNEQFAKFLKWEDFLRSKYFYDSKLQWISIQDSYYLLKFEEEEEEEEPQQQQINSLIGRLIEVKNPENNNEIIPAEIVNCVLKSNIIQIKYLRIIKNNNNTNNSNQNQQLKQIETLNLISDRHRIRPISFCVNNNNNYEVGCSKKLIAQFANIPFSLVSFNSAPWENIL